MGRYDDRFKVYHDGAFKNVKQLRVWNGLSWLDFGNNDSSSTRSLFVRNSSGGNSRVTRNREVYTIPGEVYGEGQFQLLPVYNFQFYNYSDSKGGDFNFNGTFRKTSGGDVDLYHAYRTADPSRNYIKITWMNDGRIRVMTKFGEYSNTVYSKNAVGNNVWVNIRVYSNKSMANNRINIVFNGVSSLNLYALCSLLGSSFVTNQVLSPGVQFKNTLTITGGGYTSPNNTRAITPNGSGGSSGRWTGFNKVDTSSQGVRWV